MSRSTIRNQLLIQDGLGNRLPMVPSGAGIGGFQNGIQTGTWVSSAINVDEHRRVSITVGIGSATGAAGDSGGFTGTFSVQGTDELAQCNGATGTQEAGNTSRPGINGFSGARFWTILASGSTNITNATSSVLLQFTDVGAAFIRCVFNAGTTGAPTPLNAGVTGSLGGSGTMFVYLTAKNT